MRLPAARGQGQKKRGRSLMAFASENRCVNGGAGNSGDFSVFLARESIPFGGLKFSTPGFSVKSKKGQYA
jgi:hypothetical protein